MAQTQKYTLIIINMHSGNCSWGYSQYIPRKMNDALALDGLQTSTNLRQVALHWGFQLHKPHFVLSSLDIYEKNLQIIWSSAEQSANRWKQNF